MKKLEVLKFLLPFVLLITGCVKAEDHLMIEAGWIWEGLAFDSGVEPTIYGVGEGTKYFGVTGANFMFHPNTEINFAKLSHVPKVTAEISKWVWDETKAENGRFTLVQNRYDNPDVVIAEAKKVSNLSLKFPNIVGGFIDDTHDIGSHDNYTPDTPRLIYEALHSENPDLELWIVVYTFELEKEFLKDWIDYVDVITLWFWKSAELLNIDERIAKCHEVFPGKKIIMGVYMRDFTIPAPISLDLLEFELNAIAKHLKAGTLDGYTILSACFIDQHPEQAEFIRKFIHSR